MVFPRDKYTLYSVKQEFFSRNMCFPWYSVVIISLFRSLWFARGVVYVVVHYTVDHYLLAFYFQFVEYTCLTKKYQGTG